MNMSKILSCIKNVIEEWQQLGVALQITFDILRLIEINTDKSLVSSKKEEMIVKWMDSPGPACWWLLVKALEEINQNDAADNIRKEQSNYLFGL